MKIKKALILNFKSINDLEIEFQEFGSSHLSVLLGVNESGKSNILEALSHLSVTDNEYQYSDIHCQSDDLDNPVEIYFYLEFSSDEKYEELICDLSKIEIHDGFELSISDIVKNVYIQKDSTKFYSEYEYYCPIPKGYFLSEHIRIIESDQGEAEEIYYKISKDDSGEELDENVFKDKFNNSIEKVFSWMEPDVMMWKPSDKYLINQVDLEKFVQNRYVNIPLKNIFALSGYCTEKEVADQISKTKKSTYRKNLAKKLSKGVTEYVNKIWKHDIIVEIEITDSANCKVYILDKGNDLIHHTMSSRSDGFKQFMSLILSISVDTTIEGQTNNLILIDEPEVHLHPSGVRDMMKELLVIGRDNYLIATSHSPFMVDANNIGRNIIVEKDTKGFTKIKRMEDHRDIRDEEVLFRAFGVSVYRDLMRHHNLLVEGESDAVVLRKAFKKLGYDYGVTNGHGGNIVQIATLFNSNDVDITVLVDDDNEGKGYQKKIIASGGVYTSKNVFTIRDLVGKIKKGGELEDLYEFNFVKSCFEEAFMSSFSKEVEYCESEDVFSVNASRTLSFAGIKKLESNKFIENLKIEMAERYNPSKGDLRNTDTLIGGIVSKIKSHFDSRV